MCLNVPERKGARIAHDGSLWYTFQSCCRCSNFSAVDLSCTRLITLRRTPTGRDSFAGDIPRRTRQVWAGSQVSCQPCQLFASVVVLMMWLCLV